MDVKTFGVIGAGQMGNGIAQVAAVSGFEVIMNDIKTDFVEKGFASIKKNLRRSVDKGRMTDEEMNAVLARIRTSVDIKDMGSVDFVVEAATEHEPIKFQIFNDLDQTCAPHVILATNTSSIPIGRIAARTKRPEKIIGMHFMNPVPVMKLVEVIRSLTTSDNTFKTTWDLAVKFGKTPAEANDYPGFIANRLLIGRTCGSWKKPLTGPAPPSMIIARRRCTPSTAAKVAVTPPARPSQVLFGLIRGVMWCRPKFEPT